MHQRQLAELSLMHATEQTVQKNMKTHFTLLDSVT